MNLVSNAKKELARVQSEIDGLNDRNEAINHELKQNPPWQVKVVLWGERATNNGRLFILEQMEYELREIEG